jgi:hypothetical protein
MRTPVKRPALYGLALLIFIALFSHLSGCKMTNDSDHTATRNEKLPLFEPHVQTFNCIREKYIPLDAEADKWFKEARALESPHIFFDDRDYGKILTLTRQAAERNHWQAMLNLASLYLEGKDPAHNTEDALRLVEKAMKLGIGAAYDRMGTYYMNGTGVVADATRAYAFWQRAAQMGNPDTLTFIGEKLLFGEDQVDEPGWANSAVGIKMLECAYSQGDGNAAFELGLTHIIPVEHATAKADLALALNFFHEGVKLGSQKCAGRLWIEFDQPMDPLKKIAPYVDHTRAERYRILSGALDFDPDRRFPNLDKILPLPPADLPPWNGDRETLLDAARGVSYPATPSPLLTDHAKRKGRFFLDPHYRLMPTDDVTDEATAPFTGYWQPIIDEDQSLQDSSLKTTEPALYQIGERFERLDVMRRGQGNDGAPKLQWRNWRTVRHDQGTISPPVVTKRTRSVTPPAKATACAGSERCAATGTWQPWIHAEHVAQDAVNQYWRQAWLLKGQCFPDPKVDWMLDVADANITWYLMDSAGIDLCPA